MNAKTTTVKIKMIITKAEQRSLVRNAGKYRV